MSADSSSAARTLLHGVAADKFVEVALLAACGFVLHHQGKVVVVKLLEPVIPGDFFEGIGAAIARKIETDHANVIAAAGIADT
ncbi:MAG TPA: hypothetical protein VF133_18365 [Terriglobales bacterium]